jgi:hypothetical protein
MACFDPEAVIVAAHGRRIEGADAIRAYYASTFAKTLKEKTTSWVRVVGVG